jgi:hypothetical protein
VNAAGVLRAVEQDIRGEVAHYHLAAQPARFAGVFVSLLGAQLLAGAPVLGWADVRSLLAAAAFTAFRQWRQMIPAGLPLKAVQDAAAVADAPAPPPAPPAAQPNG